MSKTITDVIYKMMKLPDGKNFTAVIIPNNNDEADLFSSIIGAKDFTLNRLESIIQFSTDSEEQLIEALDMAEMMDACIALDLDLSRRQTIFQGFVDSLKEDFGIKMDQDDIINFANQVDAPVNAAHISETPLIFVINLDHIMLFNTKQLSETKDPIKPIHSVMLKDIDSADKAWKSISTFADFIKKISIS